MIVCIEYALNDLMFYYFFLWFRVRVLSYFFFFKQKTAYEMRISDWSSDVCSSVSTALPATQHALKAALRMNPVPERLPALVFDVSPVIVDRPTSLARKSGVWGKSVSMRIDLGCRRIIKKQK